MLQRPRLMARDRLIPCVAGAFYEVTPAAVRKLAITPDDETDWWYKGPSGVAIVSDDYYVHALGGRIGHDRDAYVVADGTARLLDERTSKEAFIHSTEFDTPLGDYRVAEIGFPASFARGHSVGLCVNERMCKIVEFRDGRWWDVCDVRLTERNESPILEADDVGDAYFGTLDGRRPGFTVICGRAGRVIYREFAGGEEDRSVAPRQESSEANLIRAWGVHPELYWLLGDRGEVWERRNGRSRVVVRGLDEPEFRESDDGFRSVWVSPTGVVFAVTTKQLFRLG